MSKRSSSTPADEINALAELDAVPVTENLDLTELDKAHAIAYDLAQQAQKRQLNDVEKALVTLAENYKPMGEIKPAVFDHEPVVSEQS